MAFDPCQQLFGNNISTSSMPQIAAIVGVPEARQCRLFHMIDTGRRPPQRPRLKLWTPKGRELQQLNPFRLACTLGVFCVFTLGTCHTIGSLGLCNCGMDARPRKKKERTCRACKGVLGRNASLHTYRSGTPQLPHCVATRRTNRGDSQSEHSPTWKSPNGVC